jgi:antitoxin VapB
MGLNIKNREAHLLAEKLSKLTGESMTTEVTIALRERLDRVRQQQGLSLADRLLAIGRTARYALRSRFVPPIMARFFMTNADYLDDRRYVRANRYPAR